MVGWNSAARGGQRLGVAHVDEDHVPTGQQLGARPEHGMQRSDLHARGLQRIEAAAQRRLQRTQVEHHAGRPAQRQLIEDHAAGAQRRRHDDEVEHVQVVDLAPVISGGDAGRSTGAGPGIGNQHVKSLRHQELHEPAAHLAGAADHQRAPAAARAVRGDAGLLLRGQRGADQQAHHVLGQVAGNAQRFRATAHAEDHFALALVVAGGATGGALGRGHFAADGLAPGDQRQQVAIQLIQLLAQFVESHACPNAAKLAPMVPDQSLPDALPAEPLGTVKSWLAEAIRRGDQPNPNAMVLATCDTQGHPSARIVLCKDIDAESGTRAVLHQLPVAQGARTAGQPQRRAGDALGSPVPPGAHRGHCAEGQRSRERQLLRRPRRATASSAPMPARRASRWGPAPRCARSWTRSSRDIPRNALVPRPAHWGGYVLWAHTVELWVEGVARLHDRARWTRTVTLSGAGAPQCGNWSATRLQP